MILFLSSSSSGSLRNLFLLLSVHESLRSNMYIIEMFSNYVLLSVIECVIAGLLRRQRIGRPSILLQVVLLWLLHLVGGLPIDECAVLISLLALPLVGAPLDLPDLLGLEALMHALLPELVADRVILVLREAVVPKML